MVMTVIKKKILKYVLQFEMVCDTRLSRGLFTNILSSIDSD